MEKTFRARRMTFYFWSRAMNASANLARVLMVAVLAALGSVAWGADVITVKAPAQGNHAPDAKTPMGVNLEGLADYSRSCMFVDAMKTGRKVGPVGTPRDEKAECDKQGWTIG